jgi:hypothetical protein
MFLPLPLKYGIVGIYLIAGIFEENKINKLV